MKLFLKTILLLLASIFVFALFILSPSIYGYFEIRNFLRSELAVSEPLSLNQIESDLKQYFSLNCRSCNLKSLKSEASGNDRSLLLEYQEELQFLGIKITTLELDTDVR